MVYSPEEKARMESLLRVFRPYVAQHAHYDIVYSEKAGFLRIITAEGEDSIFFEIRDFDDMLRMFVSDHLMDEENRVEDYMLIDYDRVRAQLTPLLSATEEQDYCLEYMERHLTDWRRGYEKMYQERLEDDRMLDEVMEMLRQAAEKEKAEMHTSK